ncbi:MAG: hypothetical protein Q9170_005203 [Blastenia crenularia]
MANSTVISCSSLASRADCTSYIAALKKTTGNNLSLISNCKTEICDALWGSGNPDISGIGMILGYILSNVLGLFFALTLFLLPRISHVTERKSPNKASMDRLRYVLTQGCSSLYDSAIFLSFSIQIASIVMLARLDFGVSANGMGDSTAKITWAVSLLTLLPLLYIAYLPQLLQSQDLSKQSSKQNAKESLRFGLFAVCWLLSMYPFYSKMVGYFGPSLIGNGPNQVISNDEWNVIAGMCTAGVKDISDEELIAMQFFGVSGSLFVCICALLKIIWLGLQRQHEDSRLVQRIRKHRVDVGPKISVLFLTLLPIFAISQIWTILRLRGFQADISKNTGNSDFDSEWTFGQIAAITVFAPVTVECWFRWTTWKRN